MKRRVWRQPPIDRPPGRSALGRLYSSLHRLGRVRYTLLFCIVLASVSFHGMAWERLRNRLGKDLDRPWSRWRGGSASQSQGQSEAHLDTRQTDGGGGAAAHHHVEDRAVDEIRGGNVGHGRRGDIPQDLDAGPYISPISRSWQQASLASLQNGSFSAQAHPAPPHGAPLRKGGTRGGLLSVQFYFLVLGCLLFGSYLLYCLCCGGISARSLFFLKQPVMSVGGKVYTGVHVAEAVAAAWCIGCILAADLLHWRLLAPLTCCVGFSCPSVSWVLVHVMPSAYLHMTFLYNWSMCVVYTRPEDAYTDGQRRRIREDYNCSVSLIGPLVQSRARLAALPYKSLFPMFARLLSFIPLSRNLAQIMQLSTMQLSKMLSDLFPRQEQQLDDDPEHWSSVGSTDRVQLGGRRGRQSTRGRLGTDGNIDRGHLCSTCNAFVVRSDHHCPVS